ncbi:MAG TPA: permease, partial [Aestuariivirgaceae bacterium]|nr:permease [Aestuariivirgaceae bacterium]
MAFWLSSPVTDPSMLAITAGLLGWPFAIAKTVAAFAIGLAAGAITLLLRRSRVFASPLRASPRLVQGCGCGPEEFEAAFWRDAARRAAFVETGCDTGILMLKWLTVAFIAEYALRQVLPAEAIGTYIGGDGVAAVGL